MKDVRSLPLVIETLVGHCSALLVEVEAYHLVNNLPGSSVESRSLIFREVLVEQCFDLISNLTFKHVEEVIERLLPMFKCFEHHIVNNTRLNLTWYLALRVFCEVLCDLVERKVLSEFTEV